MLAQRAGTTFSCMACLLRTVAGRVSEGNGDVFWPV